MAGWQSHALASVKMVFQTNVFFSLCSDLMILKHETRKEPGRLKHDIECSSFIDTAPDRIMEKKRFNLQAPPVYDRKVTNLFFSIIIFSIIIFFP